MADKAEIRPESTAPFREREAASSKKAEAPAKPASALAFGRMGLFFAKTPVMIGIVMTLEAALLFTGVKFLGAGSPRAAVGAEMVVPEPEGHGEASTLGNPKDGKAIHKKILVELAVVESRFTNKMSGRTCMFDVQITICVKGEFEQKVKQIIKDRDASIKDRIRAIIAISDPEKLSGTEPGLETLKRLVKYQLDEIIGEGMIDEVLIPQCVPFRMDF